ncbi:plant UBX domain-containing protein 8 isoform X2 [Capsella rubella]|uniref:plant UBX domain-containing protein 8 isoform X2 n=1 Tax=Capsella rubella TaxID=81985 RepID=UPI000CD56145|nr:plant UBX domain-containing protein 8 isoform X2 [Capsella rubella]
MAKQDSLMITTFARITRTEEAYAAHILQQNGGNLNAALDAHYRLEDINLASGGYSPESEDDSINIDVQEEATSIRTNSLADDFNPNASNNLVEAPVEMRYDAFERPGHTPSNNLLQSMKDFEEKMKAIRCEEKAAKFSRHEPYKRCSHAPVVLPSNTLLHDVDDLEEERKVLRFEEKAAKFFGSEPFARCVHTPSVPPIYTSLHRIDDLEEEIKEGEDALAGHRQSHLQDLYLAHAISLSLETAEKEKQLHEKASRIGELRCGRSEALNVEQRQMKSSSSGAEALNTSYQNKPEDGESMSRDVESLIDASDLDEWSTLQEATKIGQIPESRYRSGILAPHTLSPSVEVQCRMGEKLNEEYYVSLRAEREKEIRESEARNAACRKVEVEQEFEKQLTEKEPSLPPESAIDEENAVTILIRMPSGNRLSHRQFSTSLTLVD